MRIRFDLLRVLSGVAVKIGFQYREEGFCLIGGDVQRRSFGVIKNGGILVAPMEEPRQALARENGMRATMIRVKTDGERLAEIAKFIDNGKLSSPVQKTFPIAQAKEALQLSHNRHFGGKIVLTQ